MSRVKHNNVAVAAIVAAAGLTQAFVYSPALAQGSLCDPFPAVMELADLNGSIGFVLHGVEVGDTSGFSVASAGDVNGDGVDDVIIGAPAASPGGRMGAGSSFVVFGRSPGTGGFSTTFELADLDGTNGFRLDGVEAGDRSGESVASAGDVNGDGVNDVIIGARTADPGGRADAGSSYVVFGRDTTTGGGFPAVVALGDLDGVDGFRLDGVDATDASGRPVASAGDVNGDGVSDLIIGAVLADPDGRTNAGSSYVVFGRVQAAGGFPAVLELAGLDGADGFRINGVDAYDYSAQSVASAGDVNGDGVDDLVIGAVLDDPDGRDRAGSGYVVFGRSAAMGVSFPATLELADLDGSNGFRMDGVDAGDYTGISVASAGDINGDGVGDLIIGAVLSDPGGRDRAGSSYVVFGRHGATGVGFPAKLELAGLDGTDGFRIDGAEAGDYCGFSAASVGDVNGDGVDDVAVGAYGADPLGRSFAGSSYVLFGRSTAVSGGFPAALALADLDGTEGFRLDGVGPGDYSGFSIASAGDINGDGMADLIIGGYAADPGGRDRAGKSFVIFGRKPACPPDLDGDGSLTIFDFLVFQNLFIAGDLRADFDGDGSLTIFDFLAFQNAFDVGCP